MNAKLVRLKLQCHYGLWQIYCHTYELVCKTIYNYRSISPITKDISPINHIVTMDIYPIPMRIVTQTFHHPRGDMPCSCCRCRSISSKNRRADGQMGLELKRNRPGICGNSREFMELSWK